MPHSIVQVAVPSPLARKFDYLLPTEMKLPVVGARVRVPFASKQLIGIVLGSSDQTLVPKNKLRAIEKVIDHHSLFGDSVLQLLKWASRYYAHPIGEVMTAALPVMLRSDVAAKTPVETHYQLIKGSWDYEVELARAQVQLKIVKELKSASDDGLSCKSMQQISNGWKRAVNHLIDRGMLISCERLVKPQSSSCTVTAPKPLEEQRVAVSQVYASQSKFQPFLLNGVTGSGKTEVYLRLIENLTGEAKQVLIMVPEISLTPQLLDRFKSRLSCSVVTLHSQMTARQRGVNWLYAANGEVDVVIGTRSAIFTPMPRLGLIIIDEEHDSSLKQQDGFRYHARDLALVRARDAHIPILLGSATPSLESLFNVKQNKFIELLLAQRAGNAKPPKIGLLDVRRRKMIEGLSDLLLEEISRHYNNGGQALVFINRRGFAPVLMCADCGASADCNRCDAHMTVHAKSERLRCHHCGSQRPLPNACEDCGSVEFDKVGYGSERIEAALRMRFPRANIVRIDRDTTRRKGALEKHLQAATSGEADILVGTQMLAKGHHFPNVTLVGILDADRGLFGTDFRSLEQMGQLITQVAGRAGRAARMGEVLIQTRNPEHELLRLLIAEGYNKFATEVLRQRREAELPPYSYVVLLRAESPDKKIPEKFLRMLVELVRSWIGAGTISDGIMIFGPVVAPMERLGGRYRYQLMFQCSKRRELNVLIGNIRKCLESHPDARKVRWSMDVDPVDLF